MKHGLLVCLLFGCIGCEAAPPVALLEPVVSDGIGKLTPLPKIPQVLPFPPADPKPNPAAEQIAEVTPEPVKECSPDCQCGPDCDCVDCCCKKPEAAPEEPAVGALFTAEWCRYCPAMLEAVEALAVDGLKLDVIDINKRPDLARHYGIAAPPAIVKYGNQRSMRYPGRRSIEQIASIFGVEAPQSMAAAPSYMQGNPMAPQQDAPPVYPWALRLDIRPDDLSVIAKGSGVVVGKQGDEWIGATCSHVVSGTRGRLRVNCNGYWWPARVVKYDHRTDIAFVAFKCPVKQFEPAICPLAAVAPAEGDTLISHGFVGGMLSHYQQTTALEGNQADAMFLGGESGGAVTNEAGELVGLISASSVSLNPDEGDGRMVPLDVIRKFLATP